MNCNVSSLDKKISLEISIKFTIRIYFINSYIFYKLNLQAFFDHFLY